MGTLYIVSTPIGNLEDITVRAIRTLLTVDYVACEDTRRSGLLLNQINDKYAELLGLSKRTSRLLSYRDQNEESAASQIISLIERNNNIALVSDAGTPLLSDPGFIVIREAYRRHMKVVVIPGASAITASVVISGLPVNHFTYLGYPPEKGGHRKKLFRGISTNRLNETYIMFVAPHKLERVFQDMLDEFGDIPVTIIRELTKIHEERKVASVSEHLKATSKYKGEIVIIFNV